MNIESVRLFRRIVGGRYKQKKCSALCCKSDIESDHYCIKSYFNAFVSKPSTLYRTVRNMANIDRPSFIAELSSVSEFSSVEKTNQYCNFSRTVLDKHAPPSLRKVINHNSSPWFLTMRDELCIAKGEKRQAERKWKNAKLTIFNDL